MDLWRKILKKQSPKGALKHSPPPLKNKKITEDAQKEQKSVVEGKT